jgi:hypothetical protein
VGWPVTVRRSILAAGVVICLGVTGAAAYQFVTFSPAAGSAAGAGAGADSSAASDDIQVTGVRGAPVYTQCSTRDRSLLSAPGTNRGGKHRGFLRPKEQLVVTGETRWWKRGHRPDDPTKEQVFVMAKYLTAGSSC